MKKWAIQNSIYFIGAVVGGLAGFIYWQYIGCSTGTCTISSKLLNSTLDVALMGAVLFGLFQKRNVEKSNKTNEGKQ